MTIVTISGIDVNKYLAVGSLNIDEAIGERSTCTFVLNCKAGEITIDVGSTVEVYTDGKKLFGGTIDNIDTVEIMGTEYIRYTVECADWHQICDRRIVSEAYENMTAGDIVTDIINKYLASEGIFGNSVQQGAIVEQAVFNYVSATQCLEKLAELSDYAWWIDSTKRLHFSDRALYSAPLTLTETSAIRNVKLSHNRDNYRNRQYIRAGKGTTDPQTEAFKGNGTQKTFTVGFPIAKAPTIKVNGTAKTVGIKGIDEGKDWYWNKGDAVITQDNSGTILTSEDTLEITYQGLYDIIVLSGDDAEIINRQNIEGGTGLYEAINEEAYLDTSGAAFQVASALLGKYAKFGKVLSFNTLLTGLHAGQLIQVDLPNIGAVGEYLIRSVTYSDFGIKEYDYFFDVEAVSCFAAETWTQFFKTNLGRPRTYVIRENIQEQEVLIRLVQQLESTSWAELLTQTVFLCYVPALDLYPSEMIYPC